MYTFLPVTVCIYNMILPVSKKPFLLVFEPLASYGREFDSVTSEKTSQS